MSKILLLILALTAVLLDTATAANFRRTTGGGTRGSRGSKDLKAGKRRATDNSVRNLKGHKGYAPGGYEEHHVDEYETNYKYSGGKGKGKKGKKSGKRSYQMMSKPKCRPVVEGAEFIIEGSIIATMANDTDDSGIIGTNFIYNGPLLEFNDRDELQELENFFMSGSCVRTQERDGDMPGAGHCGFTITLDTGATVNFGGEAFDGWDNLMAINGGSQELIGLSGTVTLIGLSYDFEDTSEDFFEVPWIYGEAVLVYSICPQGYWDQYYIDDHDALPPPSIPDPFQRQAVLLEPALHDDDDTYGDDHYGPNGYY